MKDMADAFQLKSGQSFAKQRAIDWFKEHYPKIKLGTIIAHLTRLSTNAPSRIHYSAKPGEDDIFYQIDGGYYRLYNPNQDPPPIYGNSDDAYSIESQEDNTETIGATEFAYESDLRNYLSKNLHIIEAGLHLYEEEGVKGIEYPAGGRFIDILAVDRNGDFVVIELKVSRGYDRVVGQLMRYMALIKENQAESTQKVRGIIVAREISKDLLLASSLIKDVSLFEYEISLSLRPLLNNWDST